MKRTICLLSVLAVVALAAAPARAQQSGVLVRTSFMFENYSLDEEDFGNPSISEFTLPVTITAPLSRYGTVTLSTGFVRISTDDDSGESSEISGALDTEARFAFNLIPGRLTFLVTGSLPTGTQVDLDDAAVLSVLAQDVIGFAGANVASGGYVGTGVAGAVPLGRLALGLGATFRKPFEYEPFNADDMTLRAGSEFRLRTGVEGPVGQRTFVRFAGVFARRGKDQVDGTTANGVGNRITGYFAVNQGLGSGSSVTLYLFDVFRSSPQIEESFPGVALPRGNLFAAGAQVAIGSRVTTVSPFVEYRTASAAPSADETSLERVGRSARFGAEFRQRAGNAVTVVLKGSGLVGESSNLINPLVPASDFTVFTGYRLSLQLEVRPR